MADRERWNERYDTKSDGADEPSEFLVEAAEYLPRTGLALDVAAGAGRNSIFLADLGLEVIALDLSDLAMKKCRRRSIAAGRSVYCAVVDLERFSLPENHFDVVINFNYLNRGLAGSMAQALRPGGVLVFETLTIAHKKWKPDFNPLFLLERGELAGMFPALHLLRYSERDIRIGSKPRAVASLLAKRD